MVEVEIGNRLFKLNFLQFQVLQLFDYGSSLNEIIKQFSIKYNIQINIIKELIRDLFNKKGVYDNSVFKRGRINNLYIKSFVSLIKAVFTKNKSKNNTFKLSNKMIEAFVMRVVKKEKKIGFPKLSQINYKNNLLIPKDLLSKAIEGLIERGMVKRKGDCLFFN